MTDYTPLGFEKIALQVARDPSLVRCPRDGAVMRVMACDGTRDDGQAMTARELTRLPRGRHCVVARLDVECPACGRRALGVRPKAAGAPERAGRPSPQPRRAVAEA